jgi:hypothetical protein
VKVQGLDQCAHNWQERIITGQQQEGPPIDQKAPARLEKTGRQKSRGPSKPCLQTI